MLLDAPDFLLSFLVLILELEPSFLDKADHWNFLLNFSPHLREGLHDEVALEAHTANFFPQLHDNLGLLPLEVSGLVKLHLKVSLITFLCPYVGEKSIEFGC